MKELKVYVGLKREQPTRYRFVPPVFKPFPETRWGSSCISKTFVLEKNWSFQLQHFILISTSCIQSLKIRMVICKAEISPFSFGKRKIVHGWLRNT